MDEIRKKALKYSVNAALFCVFLEAVYLFFMYASGTYSSDFPAHIYASITGEGYSLMHLILKICNKISPHPLITAYVMGIITVATVYAVYCFLKFILKENNVKFNKYMVMALGITGICLSSIYIPKLFPHHYTAATCLTQPWHNTTYILMRMLGYLTLTVYFYIVRNYQKKNCIKAYVVFTIFLSLTNFAKPNFFLGFAPMMLAVLIYDFIKSRGKQLKNIIMFGCCVLLSMPVLFMQAREVYGEGENSSVIFSCEKFKQLYSGTDWIWAAVSNMLFPVIVTGVVIYAKKKNGEIDISYLVQAWIMYFISYGEMLFIQETGARASHGNFAWGIYFFTAVLYIICLAEWIIIYKKEYLSKKNPLFFIGTAVYCMNAASGIQYVCLLTQGKHYII